jgi:hypothetical protein
MMPLGSLFPRSRAISGVQSGAPLFQPSLMFARSGTVLAERPASRLTTSYGSVLARSIAPRSVERTKPFQDFSPKMTGKK